MDLKNDAKSVKFRQQPRFNSRYFESNAGHLFVSNVNPFNNVVGHAGDIDTEKLMSNQNDEELFEIFDKTPIKESNNSPSEELVNEIMKNCPFHNHVYMDEPYDDIDDMHEAFMGNPIPGGLYSQPTVSMSVNMFDSQYTTPCSGYSKTSRYDQVTFKKYNENNNRRRTFSNNEMMTDASNVKERAEKTTYCRPSFNMYNQEFVYKTMQRNAKLQSLVRKLVVAREREKEREAWNNYINDLKNKHRYYSNEPNRISPQYVPDESNTPLMTDDFYNRRFRWHEPNPRQNLLQDVYGNQDDMQPNVYDKYPCDYHRSLPPGVRSYVYDNNKFCYPTSSQANLLRWNRARYDNQFAYEWRQRPSGRFFRGSTIVVEKEQKAKCCMFDKVQGTTRPHLSCTHSTKTCSCKNKMCSIIRSSSIPIQTEMANTRPLPLVNEEDDKELTPPIPRTPFAGFPFMNRKLQTEKDTVAPPSPSPKPSKQDKDVNVPQKEGTLLGENAVKVPLKQEPSISTKDVQVAIKETISKQDKNVNVPFKEENLKSSKNAKNKPSKKDKAVVATEKEENFKDKFKKVTNNIAKLKDKIRQSELDNMRLKSLAKIENKIDSLMKSINSIMIDIKARKTLFSNKKNATVSCAFVTTSFSNLNRRRSDPYGLIKSEEFLCGMVQRHSSRNLTISEIGPSDLKRRRESSIPKIDDILLEEMKKSEKIKRDIEELLHLRQDRSCTVQLTFDMPTKERSTEVTDSLYKAKSQSVAHVEVEELQRTHNLDDRHRQMTIAVNTDPLGLLALLRVSAETVRQILSYVPNLTSNAYLSMLPLPCRQCVSHYICNICGAAFSRPSQLSKHIEQHNLGKTRDCCVCRNSLDMQRTRVGLFSCRYCGQRFTRAYCCELHQQTCAISLGRRHDVNSSHILLR